MKMIIEACLVDDVQETARVHLAVVDRELTTDVLGLSLAEGKALLASAHSISFGRSAKASERPMSAANLRCQLKGWHERQIRTDFGRVTRAQLAVLTSDVPAHGDWLYEVSSMATGELATLRHERSPIGGRHPSVPGAPKSHRPARQQWSLLGVSRVHPPASKGGGFRGVGYYVDLSFLSSRVFLQCPRLRLSKSFAGAGRQTLGTTILSFPDPLHGGRFVPKETSLLQRWYGQ